MKTHRYGRRLLLLLLSAAMIVSTCPPWIPARAAETESTQENPVGVTAENQTDLPEMESKTMYEVSFALPDGLTEEEAAYVVLPDPVMVEEGSAILALPEASLEGYEFAGWSADAEGGTVLEPDTLIEKNMTLYPCFQITEDWEDAGLNYVAAKDVEPDFEVEFLAYGLTEEQLRSLVTVWDVSANEAVPYVLEYISVPEEKLDLDSLRLEEEKLARLKEAVEKKEEILAAQESEKEETGREDFYLTDVLIELELDEALIRQILEDYAPDELREEEMLPLSEEGEDEQAGSGEETPEPDLSSLMTQAEPELVQGIPESEAPVFDEEYFGEGISAEEAERTASEEKDLQDLLKLALIDPEHATEKELREMYGLDEDDSLQRYWREELGLDVEDVLRLEEAVMNRTTPADGQYILRPEAEGWEQGHTFQVEILDTDRLRYLYEGEETNARVVYYNFIVHKDEVFHMSLNSSVGFIPFDEVEGVELKGLWSVDSDEEGNLEAEPIEDAGILTYSGSEELTAGETIAVYDGTLLEDGSVDGTVGYFTILEDLGNGRYSYESPDLTDVLFMPENYPVKDDGSFEDGEVFISFEEREGIDGYFGIYGLYPSAKLEAGDFITFYTGNLQEDSLAAEAGFALITSVEETEEGYQVSYEPATEYDFDHAVELFQQLEAVDPQLSEEEKEELSSSMEQQMKESGFAEEAQAYMVDVLTGKEVDLDSLEYGEELKNIKVEMETGEELTLAEIRELVNPIAAEVKVGDPTFSGFVTDSLVHFKGKKGVRAQFVISCKIQIDLGDYATLDITPTFAIEQEILFTPGISASAIKVKTAGLWVLHEINVECSLEVGTYTGLGVTVRAVTTAKPNANKDKSWDELFADTNNAIQERDDAKADALQKISNGVQKGAQKLEDKNRKDAEKGKTPGRGYVSGTGQTTNGSTATGIDGDLPTKYAAFLKNKASYVTLFNREVFTVDIGVDPLQLVHVSAGMNLVVKLKINSMIGAGITYSVAKRFVCVITVTDMETLVDIKATARSSVVDVEDSTLRVDFYIFGMIGIRAGVVLDLRVGLFSTKLDSVGIVAECGFYAELYGYLYVHFTWTAKEGKSFGAAGSLFFTTGPYVEIKFKVQAGDGKAAYEHMLYNQQWELWHAGDEYVPIRFHISQDDAKLDLTIPDGQNTVKVPDELFEIDSMALKTGALTTVNKDTNAVRSENARTFTISASSQGSYPEGALNLSGSRTWTQYNEAFFDIECYDLDEDGNVLDGPSSFQYLPATNEIYVRPVDPLEHELDGVVVFTYVYETFGFNSEMIQRAVYVHWTGTEKKAIVEYYLQEGTGTEYYDGYWKLADYGEVDGFDGIRYDIELDEELLGKYPGYVLYTHSFAEEDRLRELFDLANTEKEAAEEEYRKAVNEWWRTSTTTEISQEAWNSWEEYLKRKALWVEAGHNYWEFKNHNDEAIRNQEGTLYFIMRGDTTICRLFFKRDETRTLWCVIPSEDSEEMVYQSYVGRPMLVGTPVLDNMAADLDPGLPEEELSYIYKDRANGIYSHVYDVEWYLYRFAEGSWGGSSYPSAAEAQKHRDEWVPVTEETVVPRAGFMVIGVQVPKTFTVTWMDGLSEIRTDTAAYGSRVAPPTLEARDDYYYSSWKDGNGTVYPILDGYLGSFRLSGDTVLFANWIGYSQTVTWVLTNGDGSEETKDSSVKVGEKVLESCPFTPPEGGSYVWTTVQGDDSTMVSDSFVMPNAAIRLYGRLGYGKRTVTWVVDEETRGTLSAEIGSLVALAPLDDGYIWTLDGKPLLESFTMPDHDITVIAVAHTHAWDEGTVVKAADCRNAGERLFTCTACGAERREEIPADPDAHVHGANIWHRATCVTTGGTWKECSVCGEEYELVEEEPIDPSFHLNIEQLPRQEATCTEKGYESGLVCADCGVVLSGREEISALGHNWSVWVTRKEATCEEAGEEYRLCYRCGETETRVIEALTHSWEEPTYEWAADHSSVTAVRVCSRNPGHVETETVPAASVVTKEPTYDAMGETTYTSGTFANGAFKTQTITVADIPAKEEEWGEPTYEWALDHLSVKATRVRVDGGRTEEETVSAVGSVDTAPDCHTMGWTLYQSVEFTNPAFTAQQIRVQDIPVLTHQWETYISSAAAYAEPASSDTEGAVLSMDGSWYLVHPGSHSDRCTLCGDTREVSEGFTGICAALCFDGYITPFDASDLASDLISAGYASTGALNPYDYGCLGYMYLPVGTDAETAAGSDIEAAFEVPGSFTLKETVLYDAAGTPLKSYDGSMTLTDMYIPGNPWAKARYVFEPSGTDYYVDSEDARTVYIEIYNDHARAYHDYHTTDTAWSERTTEAVYTDGYWTAGRRYRTCTICGLEEEVEVFKLTPLVYTDRERDENGIPVLTYQDIRTNNSGAVYMEDITWQKFVTIYYSSSGAYNAADAFVFPIHNGGDLVFDSTLQLADSVSEEIRKIPLSNYPEPVTVELTLTPIGEHCGTEFVPITFPVIVVPWNQS